jgi:hypothetical protein
VCGFNYEENAKYLLMNPHYIKMDRGREGEKHKHIKRERERENNPLTPQWLQSRLQSSMHQQRSSRLQLHAAVSLLFDSNRKIGHLIHIYSERERNRDRQTDSI